MKEEFKRMIRKRLIFFWGLAGLFFLFNVITDGEKNFILDAFKAIFLASLFAAMYSIIAAMVCYFRIAFIWKKYRLPGTMDVILDNPTNFLIAYSDKTLNENGIRVRNQLLTNIFVFFMCMLIGVASSAIIIYIQ